MEAGKMNKIEQFHDRVISLRKQRSKVFYTERSFYIQYIDTYVYQSVNLGQKTML